jgi:V/A-type H+-transporting ATPase subunit I
LNLKFLIFIQPMAIVQMKKVIIASFKDEAGELLEELQQAGIMQVLDVQHAVISKDEPELQIAPERPRQIAERLEKLEQAIAFLSEYAAKKAGMAAVFAPKTITDRNHFTTIVSSESTMDRLESCRQLQQKIHSLKAEIENISAKIQQLAPWEKLTTPLEEIGRLQKAAVLAGFLSARNIIETEKNLSELAVVEQIGTHNYIKACVVVCFKENIQEVHKILRGLDFEFVSFAGLKGTAAELLRECRAKFAGLQEELTTAEKETRKLSDGITDLQILADYYQNLLSRQQAQSTSPQTEQTVILEGWVKRQDFEGLKEIVGRFAASSINEMPVGKDEDIPVEIDNKPLFRPFEVITRLYGMPQHVEFDPTVLLTPFFAVFFGLCLGDAGYGLMIIAAMAYLILKMQGDKKLLWLLLICSIFTVGIGALMGSWFGDAPQQLSERFGWTFLVKAQKKLMWFDPLAQPMIFFKLALGLGYFQIMTGIVAAMIHNIRRKDFISALCDRITWLVMLNCLVLFLFGKKIGLTEQTCSLFGKVAIVPAVTIVLFSQRQGPWLGRLGMGTYNLFSTVFYMGDVLSYLRLMALGMLGSGLAMAINVMAGVASKVPYAGIVLAVLVLIGGHTLNVVLSAIGAFVHTLRLQFVEFFPKFLAGGGQLFEPLNKKYKYVYMSIKK